MTRVGDFIACGGDDFREERRSEEQHISSGIGLLRKRDSLKTIKLGQKAQFAHIIHRTKNRVDERPDARMWMSREQPLCR